MGQNRLRCNTAVTIREPLLALVLLAAAPLQAQNAELSGLITDPSGRAAPSARISVENSNTGATRNVSSNPQGEYSIPALSPGPYTITVQADGFKTAHQQGVGFEVAPRAPLDFPLPIGNSPEAS